MANITVTHSFVNGTTADATEVNTNFTDIINGTSDGTKDFSINALTCAGAAILNGNVTLGNATGDTITPTGRLAADLDPSADNARDFGATALAYKAMYSYDFFASLGAVGTPSFSFNGDADTGMWSSAANIINFSAGGTEILEIDGTSIDATVPFNVVSANDSSFSGGGKFGIGATTIDENLHIEDSSANSDVHIKLENDASSILLGIEGSDGDKGKLMVGTNDLVEFNADTFTLQPQASSASANVLEVRSFNASYTGDVVNIESATSSSSSFNFISVIGDYDGTPTDVFYVRGDGKVSIGTPSPSTALHVEDSNNNGFVATFDNTDTTANGAGGVWIDSGATGGTAPVLRVTQNNGADTIIEAESSGSVAIGTSGPSGTELLRLYKGGYTGTLLEIQTDASSGDVAAVQFRDSALSAFGSDNITIDATNNQVDFNTTSDRRIKMNFKDFNGSDLVRRLKPLQFEKKCNPGTIQYGFIAQTVNEVYPIATTYNKENDRWGLNATRLVGINSKAIVETLDRLDALEAKVEALEAKVA